MKKKINLALAAGAVPNAADDFVGHAADAPKPARRVTRLNVEVDDAAHRRLKVLAAERGVTIADIIRGLIRRELEGGER